jgi:hypothetical protein
MCINNPQAILLAKPNSPNNQTRTVSAQACDLIIAFTNTSIFVVFNIVKFDGFKK